MLGDGFYYEAARIIEGVKEGKGRIKSLCYAAKHSNKKALFALVTESCKNYEILRQTLDASQFLKSNKNLKLELAIVLLYELVNDRSLECSKKLADPILRNKTRLKAEYVKVKIRMPTKEVIKPMRYARVNTLVCSVKDCITKLKELGYNEIAESTPGKNEFFIDCDINEILVFAPGADIVNTDLYRNGNLVLQDKASCMPVAVLNPPLGGIVLDACAAPGNKTSQLAASVDKSGVVYAFERDKKRFVTLQNTLKKYKCSHAVAKCMDFLRVNPQDYKDVEYALVDPSCSGSGMLEEFENINNDKTQSKERLKTLSNFQCMIVRHAMKFPNLKKIVYSTCSIHKEENEDVVKQVLDAEPNFRLVKDPLPTWKRRGLSEYEFSQDVIRADPVLDRMNGFFVACFEKIRQ